MLMKKKAIVFVMILAIMPCLVVVPCGPYSPPFRGYSLINPEILGQKIGKPFLFSEAYYQQLLI